MKKAVCVLMCCLFILGSVLAGSPSDLQYSTYLSTPSNYASYNCYGYAIGEKVACDPGSFSSTSYTNATSFENCIVADLQALGYSVRRASSPTSTLKSNEVMIAYYYGTWSTDTIRPGTIGEYKGYHFWVKQYNGSPWYHKFGTQSGIMKYNYVPRGNEKAYASDEYYNGITQVYSAPWFYADSGSSGWGYIIFNYYDDVMPQANCVSADVLAQSVNEDHSAGAISYAIRSSYEASVKK